MNPEGGQHLPTGWQRGEGVANEADRRWHWLTVKAFLSGGHRAQLPPLMTDSTFFSHPKQTQLPESLQETPRLSVCH